MKYFKNTELAELYHVSEKSVRNWIQSAQEGKLDLQLYEQDGRFHVANTTKNTILIEELAKRGKKFKNTRGLQKINPKPDFYKIYDNKQILDIISNITVHHEIPREYCYFNGGANAWDEFTSRLSTEQISNIVNSTVELLETTASYIDRLTDGYRKVNVVDLGPGNGLPIRSTLERLIKQQRLNRYIAIDISQDMVDILKKNITEWFGDSVNFESYIRDISYERFDDLFVDDYAQSEEDVPANLVFLLGGTLNNFRSPDYALQSINSSLGPNDLFVFSCYLDTPNTRRYFDFNTTEQHVKVPPKNGIILDFLNIDESLYDVEQVFNESLHARSISICPKKDLSLIFEFPNGTRYVELKKGEPILLWRHRHRNIIDIIKEFDKNGFDLQQAVKSKDQNYFLSISKIKSKTA